MTQPIRIGFPDAINRTEITIAAPVGKQSPQVTTVGDAAPINADVVQVQPHYPGGEMGLQKFLSGYKVPQEAINNKVSGILYVQFIVETDGSISDVKVLRDLKYGTAEEAIRLMKSSPKWIPGISNGRKVRVVFTQPIRISAN
jgi:protein TonB